MAQRRKRKSSKHPSKVKGGISTRQRNTIKKEAEKTRNRIKRFMKNNPEGYNVPDPGIYTLSALLKRIEAGEKPAAIVKELKSITSTSLKASRSSPIISDSGYELQPSELSSLRKAVNTANRNISRARKKYSDFADIMPAEFSYESVIKSVISPESVRNKLKDLSLYTPKNLIPTSINDIGEAGTIAERDHMRNILERENMRRLERQEENRNLEDGGYFKQQSDYDTQTIDIDSIKSFDNLKKRAETWDDSARVTRANLFLENYTQSLNMFETILMENQYWNSTVGERIDFIRDTINSLYFNEKAITYLSTRVPDIDISLLYAGGTGDVDFSSIYDAWCEIADEFG